MRQRSVKDKRNIDSSETTDYSFSNDRMVSSILITGIRFFNPHPEASSHPENPFRSFWLHPPPIFLRDLFRLRQGRRTRNGRQADPNERKTIYSDHTFRGLLFAVVIENRERRSKFRTRRQRIEHHYNKLRRNSIDSAIGKNSDFQRSDDGLPEVFQR